MFDYCDNTTYEHVRLDATFAAIRHTFSPELTTNVEARFYRDIQNHMVCELRRTVYTHTEVVAIPQHPRTWVDAIKLRFFPQWALKRWPAKLTQASLKVTAKYPTLQVGPEGHRAYVDVVVMRD